VQTIPNTDQLSEAPAAGTRPVPRSAPGLIALEGGRVQRGVLRGHVAPAEGDLIFSTAATGWGEILTDPSYAGQIVVLTHPMAGNYRIAESELESSRVHARALVCTRLVTPPGGPGISLEDLLVRARIPALTGIDTRALTLELRRGSLRRAVVRLGSATDDEAVAEAGRVAPWASIDHVAGVATRDRYTVPADGARVARATLVDFGVKQSLLAALAARGLEIAVLPHDATADDILATAPDLIVLSPGPGDPSRMAPQIAATRILAGRAVAGGPPILGICLGHQLLGQAFGGRTHKLKFGHRGANHPVVDRRTGAIEVTSQNHGFAVLPDSVPQDEFQLTHFSANDGTLEGMVHRRLPVFSVQYHPEAAPGPHDSWPWFRAFAQAVEKRRAEKGMAGATR
jgi:carbamoyl-phosphate synthase small subunit